MGRRKGGGKLPRWSATAGCDQQHVTPWPSIETGWQPEPLSERPFTACRTAANAMRLTAGPTERKRAAATLRPAELLHTPLVRGAVGEPACRCRETWDKPDSNRAAVPLTSVVPLSPCHETIKHRYIGDPFDRRVS